VKGETIAMKRCLFILALSALLAAALSGCGGGAGTGSLTGYGRSASITFTVKWPQPSRVIPSKTKTIKIHIVGPEQFSLDVPPITHTAGKTTETVTVSNLPVGGLLITANAYPDPADPDLTNQGANANTSLASATIPFTTQAGSNNAIGLTMETTVDHLDIASSVAGGIPVGGTATLTATARDGSNNVVLVNPAKIQWSIAQGADASVVTLPATLTGLSITVTGAKEGQTALRAAYMETQARTVFGIGPISVTNLANAGNVTIPVSNAPTASQSVRVDLTDATNPQVTFSKVITSLTNGAGQAQFSLVPAGSYKVKATAFPNPDASGVAQAAGVLNPDANGNPTPLTIVAGPNPTTNPIALASTVQSLVITPQVLPVDDPGDNAYVVQAGGSPNSRTLNVTAYDQPGGKGNVVVISNSDVTWKSVDTTLATVTTPGQTTTVTGAAATATTNKSVNITATFAPKPAVTQTISIQVRTKTGSAHGIVQ
jgi:hypothetical protein